MNVIHAGEKNQTMAAVPTVQRNVIKVMIKKNEKKKAFLSATVAEIDIKQWSAHGFQPRTNSSSKHFTTAVIASKIMVKVAAINV